VGTHASTSARMRGCMNSCCSTLFI
jgi:hypothetical protein